MSKQNNENCKIKEAHAIPVASFACEKNRIKEEAKAKANIQE